MVSFIYSLSSLGTLLYILWHSGIVMSSLGIFGQCSVLRTLWTVYTNFGQYWDTFVHSGIVLGSLGYFWAVRAMVSFGYSCAVFTIFGQSWETVVILIGILG